MIFLGSVCHDTRSNTLEAVWIEEVFNEQNELIQLRRTKCRNYSPLQKAEFLADCGSDGQKYVDMAGWE